MLIKVCPTCKKDFKTYPSINQKCCSKECAYKFQKADSYNKYKKKCAVCGEEFLPPRPKEGGMYCSYTCRGVADRKERVDRNGYWYVFSEKHPNRSQQGYIGEHTIIMEKHIGRLLNSEEVAHHINHDRKDNRLENLALMTKREHRSLHMKENHAEGKVNTVEQREKTAMRMKLNNPAKNQCRDSEGKFTTGNPVGG